MPSADRRRFLSALVPPILPSTALPVPRGEPSGLRDRDTSSAAAGRYRPGSTNDFPVAGGGFAAAQKQSPPAPQPWVEERTPPSPKKKKSPWAVPRHIHIATADP